MKTICILAISFLCPAFLQAQFLSTLDKQPISSLIIGERQQVSKMDFTDYSRLDLALRRDPWQDPVRAKDSLKTVQDTVRAQDSVKKVQDTVTNKYGDLRNDLPEFNKKYPLWTVVLKVTGSNLFTFAIDRYLFNYDFSRVGFNSWKHNMETGWEWDTDRFGMNFIVHPYSGASYFNAARSSGYNFWESAPFTVLGSLEWEYFGETTLPSYNDVINTSINGIFLGETIYRIGSDILDDQTTGLDRFWREFSVFLMSPTRAFSRFTQGKMFRVTSEDVYQQEPLNVTLSGGMRAVNDGSKFWTGEKDTYLDITLDYGNPFEVRSRKPFDYFKVRVDIANGAGRKILDNITGYGLLFGRNVHSDDVDLLIGGFQHFNYFDNYTFELATIAFGPGIVSNVRIGKNSGLYTTFHAGVVPFAGNSTFYGPDTSQIRDYNYGGGAEAKLESTLNLGGWVDCTFIGYYFWIHTFVGNAGDHYIGLIKPRISMKIFRNISVGFEHLVYYSDRYTVNNGNFHQVRTEQKVYLQLYFENFKKETK
jgi:hypothetical protein